MNESPHPAARFDGAMLVSLLASGFLWLFLLAPPWSGALGLFLLGGAYVVLGSLGMAAAYAREPLVVRHELCALLALWLGAVAIWGGLVAVGTAGTITTDGSALLGAVTTGLWFGLWIGTPTFVMWQVLGLVLRGCRWHDRRAVPGPTA